MAWVVRAQKLVDGRVLGERAARSAGHFVAVIRGGRGRRGGTAVCRRRSAAKV